MNVARPGTFYIRTTLPTAVSETGDSTPGEFLDKDVSKVDDIISSLGNEEASRLGNSAVEAQGWFK